MDFFEEEDIKRAVEVLKAGGVILYPTDTVWGLGCDAANPEAVKRIFQIKRRPDSKALISLVESEEILQKFLVCFPAAAEREIERTERPLTVIYDRPRGITPLLEAPDGSAAFRITSLQFAKELCRRLGRPLVSTSANISGTQAPAVFDEIAEEIKKEADYICIYGRDLPPSVPSRILKITDSDEITVIRE